MKKQLSSLFVGLITFIVGAQGINEMVDYSTSELNGTARFKSMSGAFGALGGDLSAITINPVANSHIPFLVFIVIISNVDLLFYLVKFPPTATWN